jgi:hypothetical protein
LVERLVVAVDALAQLLTLQVVLGLLVLTAQDTQEIRELYQRQEQAGVGVI